jgi:hypothetical protein
MTTLGSAATLKPRAAIHGAMNTESDIVIVCSPFGTLGSFRPDQDALPALLLCGSLQNAPHGCILGLSLIFMLWFISIL